MESKRQAPLDVPCDWWTASFSPYFCANDVFLIYMFTVYSWVPALNAPNRTFFVRGDKEGYFKTVLLEPLFTVGIECSYPSVSLGDEYQDMPHPLLDTSACDTHVPSTKWHKLFTCNLLTSSLSYIILRYRHIKYNAMQTVALYCWAGGEIFGTCLEHAIFFRYFHPGSSCPYRCVNPQTRGLGFRHDHYNYNTHVVWKAGVGDNQDRGPDAYPAL